MLEYILVLSTAGNCGPCLEVHVASLPLMLCFTVKIDSYISNKVSENELQVKQVNSSISLYYVPRVRYMYCLRSRYV